MHHGSLTRWRPVRASLSLNRQGLAALNAGDYDEAGEMFAAALERSTKAAFLEGQTEQLGNLANVQFYLGRYADAGHLYEQAIALTQSARSSEPWVARRRWVLLANQATLFQRLGRDQEALAVYHELGTSNELRPRERAQMLVNLGVLYRHLGDPVKALNTYDEAGKIFARDHDVDGELNTVKNRGIVLALDLARLDEAERSFSAARHCHPPWKSARVAARPALSRRNTAPGQAIKTPRSKTSRRR